MAAWCVRQRVLWQHSPAEEVASSTACRCTPAGERGNVQLQQPWSILGIRITGPLLPTTCTWPPSNTGSTPPGVRAVHLWLSHCNMAALRVGLQGDRAPGGYEWQQQPYAWTRGAITLAASRCVAVQLCMLCMVDVQKMFGMFNLLLSICALPEAVQAHWHVEMLSSSPCMYMNTGICAQPACVLLVL